jgi:hypothetical protein
MNTIEKIKEEYSFIEAITGNTSCYQNSIEYKGHGKFCDVYFNSDKGELLQSQIDSYTDFEDKYQKYLPEIKNSFLPFFSATDQQKINLGNFDMITFDVIEVPYNNQDYELMLVCSITIRKFLIFKKDVCLHVKIKNGRINGVERKRYYGH